MKRAKHKKDSRRSGGHLQFFDCGPWRFHINAAIRLAANRRKYQPEMRRPTPDWIGPFIDVDGHYADSADTQQPVIFATVIQHGQPWHLLIDGNHRVTRALRQQTEVAVVTLDLEDTLKVLTAPSAMIQQMKRDGVRLGLLRPDAVP